MANQELAAVVGEIIAVVCQEVVGLHCKLVTDRLKKSLELNSCLASFPNFNFLYRTPIRCHLWAALTDSTPKIVFIPISNYAGMPNPIKLFSKETH